jgi:hypothetical protein
MRIGKLLKRLLVAVVAGLLALCLLFAGLVALVWYYPQLGRLPMQALSETTSLEGTDYILELVGAQFLLENAVTHSKYPTGLHYRADDPMVYTVLQHHGSTYLIVGGDHEGGNIGGYWFDIFNITAEPYWLDNGTLFPYLSCVYPRLEGDALLFETAHQCDIYVLAPDKRAYTVALK